MKYPLVTIHITDKAAQWCGKYTVNMDTEQAEKLGAPFKTEWQAQAACDRFNKKQFSQSRKQFLSDCINIALEGGIGYWSEAVEYHPGLEDGELNITVPASAIILEIGEQGDEKRLVVDVYAIEAGIATILAGAGQVGVAQMKAIAAASVANDAGDIDAELADCIVQAGVLGKVIYG